jgi:hypothetical protein
LHLSYPPYVLCAPSISFLWLGKFSQKHDYLILLDFIKQYLVRSTDHKAPYYVVFFTL